MDMTRRRFGTLVGLTTVGFVGFRIVEAATPAAPAKGAATAADAVWADLMKGNERFRAGRPRARRPAAARPDLAKGQHPNTIVLGCADSRVSPELVFDQDLGDLFVVRVAGNVADPAALGSLEYAVEHLHSTLLVVLGHERCGAVLAALSGETMPSPSLAALVGKIKPAIDPLLKDPGKEAKEAKKDGAKDARKDEKKDARSDAKKDARKDEVKDAKKDEKKDEKKDAKGEAKNDALVSRAVRANILFSAKSLVDTSEIIRAHVSEGQLTVIKAVYQLTTGAVTRLA